MKRGVFLLILNFIKEIGKTPNTKKRIFKKNKALKKNELNRYSINIKGKNILVLDLSEKDLMREDVITLLKIYKGRVLVPSKYQNEENIESYLFNPKEYYQRALLSSLINQIKTVNKDWKNLCVKTEKFSPYKELYEIVRISKTVSIITSDNPYTDKFKKECYYEYGAIVSVKNDEEKHKFDIFLDLDKIDNKGKLMINVKEKEFLLYPDVRYFENKPDYQKLLPFNIEHNIICSAFSDK